jgi:uncharacterized protein with beta-barrel porin domain
MKRKIALILIAVVLLATLAACGGEATLSGTYKDELDISSYTFKNGEVSVSLLGEDIPIGEFEVKDGTLYVLGQEYGTVSGNTITISGVEYKK